jgi:hypothetical protein
MERAVASVCLVGLLFLAEAASAEPEVRQHAVEEIMPGIFVRDPSGVTIDLGQQRCDPPCAEGQSCESVCEATGCDPRDGPSARCNSCRWQCE